jgi:hypothetical protein
MPDEARTIEVVDVQITEKDERPLATRPLPMAEGLRRIQERARLASMQVHATTEGEEQKRLRELREADVVEAARRSQAEIRRHVDAYLKEHFETVVADVSEVVVAQITERVMRGIAGVQEAAQVHLDRQAAEMRAQMRAFMRAAWPKQPKMRKPSARRGKR